MFKNPSLNNPQPTAATMVVIPQEEWLNLHEKLDRFIAHLVEEWLREMGIDHENTQYIIARHFDKNHPHCHLVFNRIANDGSVISDSNEQIGDSPFP